MEKPKIFLSSTIYDFQDLRGALKDYLELRGCQVFASDHNDFGNPLDKHSYEGCLDVIDRCDIFVLLIGGRVGGYVDKATKQSITRAEYEHAYELAKAGKIRIITFVRREVWNHRESVSEFEKYLARSEVSAKERPNTFDPSKVDTRFMTDASVIIDFIKLVSRNAETTSASLGRGVFPIGNWIYQFSTFSEVRSALDPVILSGIDPIKSSKRKSLELYLRLFLIDTIPKVSDITFSPYGIVSLLRRSLDLRWSERKISRVLSDDDFRRIITLLTLLPLVRVNSAIFTGFLNDTDLLSYNNINNRYDSTPEYEALALLVRQISDFQTAMSSIDVAGLLGRIGASPARQVAVLDIATTVGIALKWSSMTSTALALSSAMNGQPFMSPQPVPLSPFLDQEDQLQRGKISQSELDKLINDEADQVKRYHQVSGPTS